MSYYETGLIAAACEPRTVLPPPSNGLTSKLSNGIHNNGHIPIMKAHHNGNGFKSSNGTLNGVYANGNGVYADGSW